MKKVLSFVLVLTLVLGSFGMVFATSTNTVQKVPTVATDSEMPLTILQLKVNDQLGLSGDQTLKLTVENGSLYVVGADIELANAVATTASGSVSSADQTKAVWVAVANKDGANVSLPTGAITPITAGDKSVEFTINAAAASLIGKDAVVLLGINLKSDAEGEVKVKVDGGDSQFTSGTYTVAVAGGNNTIATVSGDPKKTGRTSNVEATSIEIREVGVNSVYGQQIVKLSLPKGVSWKSGTTLSGNMVTGSVTGTISSSDDRDITFTFTPNANAANREVLVIKPFISVGKDARLGDIEVQIRNQGSSDHSISDASGLIIAKYSEEGVTVTTKKEADLPLIIAGREMKDSKAYTVEVTLEEIQKGSLIPGKYVDFSFPEWVQLTTDQAIKVKVNGTEKSSVSVDPKQGDVTKNRHGFEYYVGSELENKANKLVFEIPVTVEADKTGDIELTVSGAKAGVDETKLVVGKVIAPLTAEVKISNIKTGVQNQAIADILIKETSAGAIRDLADNNTLELWISQNGQNIKFSSGKAEVVAGDLDIKEAKTKDIAKNGSLVMTIDRSSIKTPAEIKITGVELSPDRTPAQGMYSLNVGGDAVVDNWMYKNAANSSGKDSDFTDAVVSVDYVNVVTPADQGVKATFTIGESKYTVNGAEKTMDAASYIDSNGRTMVPIRHIANALGVDDNKIVWNQATKTATIFGKNTVIITVGENKLTVNGAVVPMDTVAVNNNGRIFVPARYIANALGASVEWDNANRVVTLTTIGL